MFGKEALIKMAVNAIKKIADDNGGKIEIKLTVAKKWFDENHKGYDLILTNESLTLKKK